MKKNIVNIGKDLLRGLAILLIPITFALLLGGILYVDEHYGNKGMLLFGVAIVLPMTWLMGYVLREEKETDSEEDKG